MTSEDAQYFLRDAPYNGLDAVAFHYSIYRSFQRFLGMDGNLQVAYDVSVNFVSAWNQMFVENDFINAFTGEIDPRHMYGTSNFDVFRWNSLNNGTQKSVLGTFIATLLMPGIPLVRVFCSHPNVSHAPPRSCTTVRSRTSTCTITPRTTTSLGACLWLSTPKIILTFNPDVKP